MKGRRRPLNEDGFFADEDQPGDYGHIGRTLAEVHGHAPQLWWSVKAPDGSVCSLNPQVHQVIEHDDGTITVNPSIVTSTWHGWLRAGIWTSV